MNTVTLLTSDEVASMLRISKKTLSNYRWKGIIPYVRVGGRAVRYKANAIAEWIEESSKAVGG